MYNGIYDKEQFAYVHDMLVKWLKLKINGGSISDLLLEKGIESIVLYGIRGIGELIFQDLRPGMVKCFIDKRYLDYQNGYRSLPVYSIKDAGAYVGDSFILVTPEYFYAGIMQELTINGIALDRIITLSMLF